MNPPMDHIFVGLVGPTHNYAGLSFGNVASAANKGAIANPRAAALQSIALMRGLHQRIGPVGVMAPLARPNLAWLRALGFQGSDHQVWEAAWKADQRLARQAIAASSMWAANAATVSAGSDCADGRVHFTPANLLSMPHRAHEARETAALLRRMFADPAYFCVHDPLPAQPAFADEGAANVMTLRDPGTGRGHTIFVYGREADEPPRTGFPARQTKEAFEAIARRHGLDPAALSYWRQAEAALDAGAFHNDVVGVSCDDVVFAYEGAYAATPPGAGGLPLRRVTVPQSALSFADVVSSYLFNSQLVRARGANAGELTLLAPIEVQENPKVWAHVQDLAASGGPIRHIEIVDVRESMRNGGGPACLRLRVPLTPQEAAAMPPGFVLDEGGALASRLEAWAAKHYRDRLAPADLADPGLIDEADAALDALTAILPLGSDFYPFQR
jgi:succinylarginine dihydrolase